MRKNLKVHQQEFCTEEKINVKQVKQENNLEKNTYCVKVQNNTVYCLGQGCSDLAQLLFWTN